MWRKLLLFFLVISIVLIVWAGYQTWALERSETQKLFLTGTIPEPLPNGDYKGTTSFFSWPWYGKTFDSQMLRGVNIFHHAWEDKRFPFKTEVTHGIRDKELMVLRLDYNVSENPLFLRVVVDEIVEIEPGVYLGKAHVRLIPDYPFTLTFFRLEKAPSPEKLFPKWED